MFNIFSFDILTKYSSNISLNPDTLSEALNTVFSDHNVSDVNIIFTTSEHIQKLNSEYRERDSVTDVLSFGLDEQNILGEIYICPEYVYTTRGEAEYQVEILRLIVHGMLHLIGYDHQGEFTEQNPNQEQMFVKQEEILQNILKNI